MTEYAVTNEYKWSLLKTLWEREAASTERVAEIDPLDQQDWYSLALGWAIAKGLPVKAAHDFAVEVCYNVRRLL